VRRADNLTTYMCRLSKNRGASTTWNPKGLSRPVMGLLYLYHYTSCCCYSFFSQYLKGYRTDRRVCCMCDDITALGRRNHRKLLSCVSGSRLVQNNVACAIQANDFRCSGIQGEKRKAGMLWPLTGQLTDRQTRVIAS
jgi:hypothetical protein